MGSRAICDRRDWRLVGGFRSACSVLLAVGLIGQPITATVGAMVLLYVVQVLKKA